MTDGAALATKSSRPTCSTFLGTKSVEEVSRGSGTMQAMSTRQWLRLAKERQDELLGWHGRSQPAAEATDAGMSSR